MLLLSHGLRPLCLLFMVVGRKRESNQATYTRLRMQVGKGGEKGTLHIMWHVVNGLFNVMRQSMKALHSGVRADSI